MQHVYSTHVRDLHKTIHFTCKACGDPTVVYSSPFSFVTGLHVLKYWGVILNLMYKKASLSDVQPATV